MEDISDNLDFSFLSLAERTAILAVLDRNDRLVKQERARIRALNAERPFELQTPRLKLLTGEWFTDITQKKEHRKDGDYGIVRRALIGDREDKYGRPTVNTPLQEKRGEELSVHEFVAAAENSVPCKRTHRSEPNVGSAITAQKKTFAQQTTSFSPAEYNAGGDVSYKQEISLNGRFQPTKSTGLVEDSISQKEHEICKDETRFIFVSAQEKTFGSRVSEPHILSPSEDVEAENKPLSLEEIISSINTAANTQRRIEKKTNLPQHRTGVMITQRESAIFKSLIIPDDKANEKIKPSKTAGPEFFRVTEHSVIDMDLIRKLVAKETRTTTGTKPRQKQKKKDDERSYYVSYD